jgi:hypothetical protein
VKWGIMATGGIATSKFLHKFLSFYCLSNFFSSLCKRSPLRSIHTISQRRIPHNRSRRIIIIEISRRRLPERDQEPW